MIQITKLAICTDVSEYNEQVIIKTKLPLSIFIIKINEFTSFRNNIKELTKDQDFFCKISLNDIKFNLFSRIFLLCYKMLASQQGFPHQSSKRIQIISYSN